MAEGVPVRVRDVSRNAVRILSVPSVQPIPASTVFIFKHVS
jgi:hypothetical protein